MKVHFYPYLFILFLLSLSTCQIKDERQHRVEGLGEVPLQISQTLRERFDLQGHRGARGLLPENSIAAFIKALELGVNTLEMDVVISQDSQIVVSHEAFFSPKICLQANGDSIPESSERNFNLYQMTLEEIQGFDCGSLGHPDFPEQKAQKSFKPSLKQVVEAVEKYRKENKLAPIYYNIETKSSPEGDSIFHPRPADFARLLYQEIKALELKGQVSVQSFDPRTLREFNKMDQEIPLVFLSEDAREPEYRIRRLGFTPSVYSPNFKSLNREILEKAHEMGMKVIPWTVNEKEDMQKMIKLGVDGLITDYPNRFLELKTP